MYAVRQHIFVHYTICYERVNNFSCFNRFMESRSDVINRLKQLEAPDYYGGNTAFILYIYEEHKSNETFTLRKFIDYMSNENRLAVNHCLR